MPLPSELNQVIPPLSERDHIRGAPNAIIILMEYGDYQCPQSGQAHVTIKGMQQRLGEQLCFLFTVINSHWNRLSGIASEQNIFVLVKMNLPISCITISELRNFCWINMMICLTSASFKYRKTPSATNNTSRSSSAIWLAQVKSVTKEGTKCVQILQAVDSRTIHPMERQHKTIELDHYQVG